MPILKRKSIDDRIEAIESSLAQIADSLARLEMTIGAIDNGPTREANLNECTCGNSMGGFICNRPKNHLGDHVAYGNGEVCCRWPRRVARIQVAEKPSVVPVNTGTPVTGADLRSGERTAGASAKVAESSQPQPAATTARRCQNTSLSGHMCQLEAGHPGNHKRETDHFVIEWTSGFATEFNRAMKAEN